MKINTIVLKRGTKFMRIITDGLAKDKTALLCSQERSVAEQCLEHTGTKPALF